MCILSRKWKVKFKSNFLSSVGLKLHKVWFHIFWFEHWHCTLWNLVEKGKGFCFWWNISENDFAFVGCTWKEWIWHAWLLLRFICSGDLLVTMNNFNVPFEIKICFSDKLFVENEIRSSFYCYTTLLIRSKRMIWGGREW